MDSLKVNQSVIELIQGDITQQETDAVVNAANGQLAPGGGVAGAIHRAAGPELWEYTKTLGGCRTGEAVITYGFNLKARYIIHTVGPVYSGSAEDAVLLRSCYIESLKLASSHDAASLSFPAISTGIFGYPPAEAAEISLTAVRDYLREHPEIQRVRFVLFSEADLNVYRRALEKIKP
jgi:O-acetyl-ADP-ribose deacetylase